MIKIQLKPASDYRRTTYGIMFESITDHSVVGVGVHNRSFPHLVEVWFNKKPGFDPSGYATTDQVTLLLSAQSVMIADTPVDRPRRGETLTVGDEVEVDGFGTYRITTRSLADPQLIRVN